MVEDTSTDLYYRGNDLMQPQQKLLFQKIQQTIQQEQGEIVYILSSLENNSHRYQQLQKEQESLATNEENLDKLQTISQQMASIHTTQNDLLFTLQPMFNQLFDQIGRETQGGMGYNEILRSYVWQDLIEIFRKEPGAMDGSRDNYRNTAIRQQKKSAKNTEKGKQKKEKVQLPHDHQLLTKETYPQLQTTMWTYLDNVVNTYKQKFLKDIKDGQQIKGLIDHYFLFIFIQMLVQSKVVFDTKRPQSNPFIQQVIDDCISHLDGVHGVSLSISSESIKKKLFHTVDETSIPLELLYKNSMEEDILDRERYFNIYFFTSQKTSVDHIRRQIMLERKENSEKMRLGWELINPAYHIAKDKKEKLITTIGILEKHQAEDNCIKDLLSQLQESLKKSEEDMKKNVVFEDDSLPARDVDSLVKLQQQYLKRYQVPVQYRKIFGLVINRLNNFYQIKTNLFKKAQKNNNEAFDHLINSDQTTKDILYHINGLITHKDLSRLFDQKWTQKQVAKTERIQLFCLGKKKVFLPHNPINKDQQMVLDL